MSTLPGGMSDVSLFTDVAITWIAAAVVLRYAHVLGRGQRSLIERRARVFTGMTGALMFVRGFDWLYPDHAWLVALALIPSTLLPIAMLLFTEAMLRRHAPRSMKIAVVAASVLALLVNEVRVIAEASFGVQTSLLTLGVIALTMIACGVLLLRRDHASLSRAENTLIHAVILVAFVATPLAVTDFRADLQLTPVRMGSVGALLFCWTLLRTARENASLARWTADVARLVLRALLVAGLLLIALPAPRMPLAIPAIALAVSLVLAVTVWDKLRDSERTAAHAELLRWLARTPPKSLAAFVRELRHLSLTADAAVLHANDLAAYHVDALRAVLHLAPVSSLSRLRTRASSDGAPSAALETRGAEELTDLLERNGATHVALLRDDPPTLLIAATSELPGTHDTELALAAVVRRGQLAIALERENAHEPSSNVDHAIQHL